MIVYYYYWFIAIYPLDPQELSHVSSVLGCQAQAQRNEENSQRWVDGLGSCWFMLFNVCYCTGDVASCWLIQYTSPISDESSKRSLRKKWMFVEFLEDVLSEQRTLEFHMGRMVLWWAWWVNGSTGLWQNHFHQWHRMLLSPTWRPFSSCQRFRIATSLSSVLGYWGIKRFLAVLGMQSENHLPTQDAASIDR